MFKLPRAVKTLKRLICALRKRVVLVQVLQLAVPAPLVAGVPAGHRTPDHALEEAAGERLQGEGRGGGGRHTCPPQHSSSTSCPHRPCKGRGWRTGGATIRVGQRAGAVILGKACKSSYSGTRTLMGSAVYDIIQAVCEFSV